jgi:phenylpropionate dioxygenase-like ring-hydroxylating dioxygenase large terminal subunit
MSEPAANTLPGTLQTDVFASNPALRPYWYAVARSVDVTPGPLSVVLLGERLVVWRGAGGALTAAPDRCPHREAPLSFGEVEDGCLVCPYHGWTFGDGGTCVRVPSSGPTTPVPPKAHLSTVHVTERYGLVWLCLGEPVAGIPEIPEDADPTFRRINNPVEIWRTSATRMTDNFIDITHFPWVHTGTFGRRQSTTVPKFELEPLTEFFYGYRYEVEVNNPDNASITSGSTAKVLTRRMSSGFNLPFTVRSDIQYETGLEHVIFLLSTPIDDVTSYFTFVIWRNDDFSVSAEEVIQFDRAIGAEDKKMLERVPGVLPLDVTRTVSAPADKASVEWRRRFAALLAGGRPPARTGA